MRLLYSLVVSLLWGKALCGAALPVVGTPASPPIHFQQLPGIFVYQEGYALPLKGAVPDWYTPALDQKVRSRAGQPQMAPAQAPLPGTVGIRPGAWMVAPYGGTMNFIFSNKGKLGMGTAGHCTDKLGESVIILTLAPGSKDPVLVDIGKVVFRRDSGVGEDFALIELRPELHSWVDPTIAAVAGPCGEYNGNSPELVAHYGHGLAIGTGGTPRAGVALLWKGGWFGWDSPSIFGDSGSPVRVGNLQAAGNLTHLIVDTRYLPSVVAGTRISKILKMIPGWKLLSSDLCEESLPGL